MPDRTPEAEAALRAAVHQASGLPDDPEGGPDTALPLLMTGGTPTPGADLPEPPKSPAQSAYERLILYIRNFESQLDADHEVAMGFAGSEAGVLRIEGLGYFDPDLLTFYGRDEDGAKTQLVQHVTQLSVLLRAVGKAAPEVPARRIGFHIPTGWRGGEAGDGSAEATLSSPRDSRR